MIKDIPMGYQLKIVSCQDCYQHVQEKIISGLKEYQVRFYLDILKYFKTKDTVWSDEELKTIIGNSTETHLSKEDDRIAYHYWNNLFNPYTTICNDMIGKPVGDVSKNYCRMVCNIEVYYIETPIIDVSDKFN
jgi:hypothetical protein